MSEIGFDCVNRRVLRKAHFRLDMRIIVSFKINMTISPLLTTCEHRELTFSATSTFFFLQSRQIGNSTG